MIDPKTKRITVPVTKDIDLIRERIKRDIYNLVSDALLTELSN